MVHSKFRGKSYGYTDLLYAAAAVEARRMGARFLLLNCTPALAVMYEARGWVRYKPAVWDEGMGLQVKHLLHALAARTCGTHLLHARLPAVTEPY